MNRGKNKYPFSVLTWILLGYVLYGAEAFSQTCLLAQYQSPLAGPSLLQFSPRLESLSINPSGPSMRAPIHIRAQQIDGQTNVNLHLEGNAELREPTRIIKANSIDYWQQSEEVEAIGNVRILRERDTLNGTELYYRMNNDTGYLLNAQFDSSDPVGHGTAERVEFQGKDRYQTSQSQYTTCRHGDNSWYLRSRTFNFDYVEGLAQGENVSLYFKEIPIAWFPQLYFALDDRRRSGFLTPSFATSTLNGWETSIPYYWNIAPNRDLTLTERLLAKRGLVSRGLFRYLEPSFSGEATLAILPSDRIYQDDRYEVNWQHRQTTGSNSNISLNLNQVSDSGYYRDLSTTPGQAAQAYLPREISWDYNSSRYNLQARTQSFQVLQPSNSIVGIPYARTPEVNAGAFLYDWGGFDLSGNAQFTRFTHPSQVEAQRLVIKPEISYPLLNSYGYITPKIAWHISQYSLNNRSAWQGGLPAPTEGGDNLTRQIPIFSIDSGLFLEREFSAWNDKPYIQTLEPRLYFLRVPAQIQNNFPVFDSGVPDFNFAQIFLDNQYTGQDRIANANQVTAMLSSRFLDGTGNEMARTSMGQRFYFTSQSVGLPNETLRSDRTSDLLVSGSANLNNVWRWESNIQYNPDITQVYRSSHGMRYTPSPQHTFGLAYRFQLNLLEEIDVTAQWPLWGKWYGVGRYNYSLQGRQVINSLGGIEYDGDCWVARFVLQRYITGDKQTNTALFFQIELGGLSQIGISPLDVLRQNVPDYTRLRSLPVPDTGSFNRWE